MTPAAALQWLRAWASRTGEAAEARRIARLALGVEAR